jgi:hypothetical protein
MMWACRKIASHGFVVAVAETNSILDFPGQRADQEQAIIQSAATIAWLKRWVDNDTRYDQFLCPAPQNAGISDIRTSCPMSGT